MNNPHDPSAIYSQKYSNALAGHYRMRKRYHIRRPTGTNDWLLICTLGGKGIFRYPGGALVTRSGDMVLLQPGTPHDYGLESTLRSWELLWAHFHPFPNWPVLLNWPQVSPGLLHLRLPKTPNGRRIIKQFKLVHHLATGSLARREWFAAHAFEGMLLWCDLVNPLAKQSTLDSRIGELVEYIHHHLASPLPLEHLAKVSHLSVSRLCYIFRQQMGTTPQQFIEAQRLDRAKRLLQIPKLSIKQIAGEVGFNDPFYFSQRFHRHAGMGPNAYRRLQQGKGM